MTETPRHSVSVAAAIFDESGDNVLLIKRRDNGNWEPPGGVLELGESIEDGLRREVREETGAEIEVGPLTGIYKNMAQGIVALVFPAVATTSPASASSEAIAIEWLPVAKLDSLMEPVYAQRLIDARGHGEPAVRAHDGVWFLDQVENI